jgi:hypothetical protein
VRLIADETFGKITAWAEARGEPFDGQVAVCEVIQRRARMRYFSDGTIFGTVTRPSQFSCWSAKDPNYLKMFVIDSSDPVVNQISVAWDRAKAGPEMIPGALLYANLSILPTAPTWADPAKLVAAIGHHSFFSA